MTLLQKNIDRLMRQPGVPGVGDGELLSRFRDHADQAAFELLVHRHGPMILGLCRRLLRDGHEAEDAFQATFLTLACRARSIRREQSLGSWLYQVAFRLCRRMRLGRWCSAIVDIPVEADRPEEQVQRREEAALLAGEVDRLSDCLRSVVVLCYLQGKSSVEAARELGCPPNTVSIRLRRARERLRSRLERRGVVLSAGVAASLGATAEASVPAALASTLAGQAVRLAGGAAAAGVVAAPVAVLVKGAMVAMWWKPIKLMSLAVLATGLLAVPTWNAMPSATAQDDPRWAGRSARVQAMQDLSLLQERLVHREMPRRLKPEDTLYPPDESLPEDVKEWIAEQKKQEEAICKEAEAKIRRLRAELYKKLRGQQEKYTKAGDLDRAVAVRDQARRLEASVANAKPDPGALTSYRGQNGKSFVFTVIGHTNATIWGDGVYTDDSALGTVAVHAGLVRPGQLGVVKVTILEGKSDYGGSSKHGVTSQQYGAFPGSYRVERVNPLATAAPEDATTELHGRIVEVDKDLHVRINKGINDGVVRGQVFEVYRLAPTPRWLGRVRVMEVTATEAVGELVAPAGPRPEFHKGDLVGTMGLTAR
jgi:RNA polymerase sigma factor (sigma-70 family)